MFQLLSPETCSILDLSSPCSHNSQPQFAPWSNTVPSLDFEIYNNNNNNLAASLTQKEMNYEISRVILLKGLPEDITEIEILALCSHFGPVKDMLVKRQNNYVFVQYDRLEQAQKCFETFNKLPPIIRGHPLSVFCTGKEKLTKPHNAVGLPSRFLFIVFNKAGLSIDSGLVSQLLSPYGRCGKLLIFHNKNTQVFVEMEDVFQAVKVKESLDGYLMFKHIPVNVCYTEEKDMFQSAKSFSDITLSTNVGTLDNIPSHQPRPIISKSVGQFRDESQAIRPEYKRFASLPVNNPASDEGEEIFSQQFSSVLQDSSYNPSHFEFKPQQKTLNNLQSSLFQIPEEGGLNDHLQPTSFELKPQRTLSNLGNSLFQISEEPFNDDAPAIPIGLNVVIPKEMPQGLNLTVPKDLQMSPQTPLTPPKMGTTATSSPLQYVKEEKSTTVLLIRNLPKGVTARMLFRLFGMYGNVTKIKIFFKNPENALVEYQLSDQAEAAKNHLNNCPIYGNNIFVTNSKQGVVIDTSALRKGEETPFMGDYINSPEYRYKFSGSKNHLNVVPLSKVLHLSNLYEGKNENFYIDLFKGLCVIKKFMFLTGKEDMALMEVETIGQAVNVLMNFHNLNINGKYLKVSFSKYQRVKDV